MISRAGPGGPTFGEVVWSDLVDWLSIAFNIVTGWTSYLFKFFMTSFGDLADEFIPGAWNDLMDSIFDIVNSLLGIDLYELNFVEITLGSLIPFIMIFTIYRYLK